ncbi:MAG: YIP1 family protein, partial [Candidatus Bathyarchaeota archaeon]
KGVALVLVVAVLSAWAGMIYFSKTNIELLGLDTGTSRTRPFFESRFNDVGSINSETLKRSLAPFVAIRACIATFAKWLVPSLLIALWARILVGEGSSKRLLAMTGFASAPILLQQVLRIMDAYTIGDQGIVSMMAANSYNGLASKLLNRSLEVFNVFGIITLALIVIAVSVNYEITTRKAIYLTLLSYTSYVFLSLYMPVF